MTLLDLRNRNERFRRLPIFLEATVLLVLLAAGVLEGNSQDRTGVFLETREKIVSLIEEKKIPSLSLAVVRNGEIIWEEAFGLANLEQKIKATPETLYPIGSATKPFTATALMVLAERGLVELDKPANAYLGKVKLSSYEGDVSTATVRRLLHHTSGLPMYWSFYFAGTSRQRLPLETTLQRYGRLVTKPGESYNYSNLGYAVLESIIENVSGKPYPEFLAAEVFKPLNLRQTAVQMASSESPNVAEKYASTLAAIPFCDQDTRGAGAIYSTAHDLALFCLLHLGRLQPDQEAILKPESIAAMQRTRDPDVHNSSYALGWETGRRFGYPIITHGGVMDGCRAHLAMIPPEGLAVAVLINGENVPSIQVCDWIFAALLPQYARNMKAVFQRGSPPPPPQSFSPPTELIGTWKGTIKTHEGEISVRLIVESDGRVELARLDQPGSPGKGLSPLKTPAVNQGIFIVHFPQVFSTSDAPSINHRTVLGMKIQENRLSGEANLIASDMSYSLPSYIALKRAELEEVPQNKAPLFTVEDMQHDFNQLRRILESEHCCLYEYTGKKEFDSLFDERSKLIDRPMRYEEIFKIMAPITAKIGCMHTALWMPGNFFNLGPNNLFPLQVRLIENYLVVTGRYGDTHEVPVGSIILEINGLPSNKILEELRKITSADAFNPYFIDTQVEKRFPMFYASVFGFPEKYTVTYALPGRKTRVTADLRPADIRLVRKVIFANFNHPPLAIDFIEDKKTAVMTVKTFSYYDRVGYFRNFMDRSFRQIKEKGIENLILDLRGNDGGDPFCAVILYSYLEKEPAPYFAEPYGKYAELAKSVPLPENRFTGQLYTLLDGRCGSTNGHFCALLKYHRIGKFVGTPSGSTYKCNAGKNTEVQLDKTSVILTLGRSTYAAAVEGMDKTKPIMPDYPVKETYQDFLDGKDVYLEAALRLIESSNRSH